MKVPRPTLIFSLLLEAVGMLLLLTGMVTPQLQNTDEPIDFDQGLYYSCLDNECDEPFQGSFQFQATRALISLAFLLDVVVFLLSLLTTNRAKNMAALPDTQGRVAPGPGIYPVILLCLGVVAAALATAGLVVFHVEFEPKDSTEYGYSFYLIIAGTCVFLVGVVVLFLYILKAKHISRDKVAGFETDFSKSEDGLNEWYPYVIPRKKHGDPRSMTYSDHQPVQVYPGMDPRYSVRSMPSPWAFKVYPEQDSRGYYPAHNLADLTYEHKYPHVRVETHPSYVNPGVVRLWRGDPYQPMKYRYYNSLNLRTSQHSPRSGLRLSKNHNRQSGENRYRRQSGENSYNRHYGENRYKRQSENTHKRQSEENSYKRQSRENSYKRLSGEISAHIHAHKPQTTNLHNGMLRGQNNSAQPRVKDLTKLQTAAERSDLDRATRQGFMLY